MLRLRKRFIDYVTGKEEGKAPQGGRGASNLLKIGFCKWKRKRYTAG